MGLPQILIPFDAAEALTIAEASQIAGRSDDTVRRWAQLHDLGRRIGGRWAISRFALRMFLDNDKPALRALLAGDRESDLVCRYMPTCGQAEKNLPQKPQKPQTPQNGVEQTNPMVQARSHDAQRAIRESAAGPDLR